jgi:alpha-ketoglutarate-dependent taurine dioxygenase
MSGLDLKRIGGRIGAEVSGVDLNALDDGLFKAIDSALLEHKALIFRGAGLDDEGQIAFASRFGALTRAHPTVPSVDGQPNILPLDGEEGIRSNTWHTDVTFVRTPPKVSTLRALVVPPYGGNTLIANAAAAYRDLPQQLRDFADRLWAVHTNDYDYALPRNNAAKAAEYRKVFVSTRYQTGHPVVRVHPESGGTRPVHRRLRTADRRAQRPRVTRHPADPPGLCHPAGEHPPRRVEPRRPRRLRQPHHPALRARRLRRPAAPPAPRHRGRRRSGGHRRRDELRHRG